MIEFHAPSFFAGYFICLLLIALICVFTQTDKHTHNWTKWSIAKIEQWYSMPTYGGIPYGPKTEFEKLAQDRTCNTCGETESRYVKEGKILTK